MSLAMPVSCNHVITLAPGGDCEGTAFGYVCLYSAIVFDRARNSTTTIVPIDLIFVFTRRTISPAARGVNDTQLSSLSVLSY